MCVRLNPFDGVNSITQLTANGINSLYFSPNPQINRSCLFFLSKPHIHYSILFLLSLLCSTNTPLLQLLRVIQAVIQLRIAVYHSDIAQPTPTFNPFLRPHINDGFAAGFAVVSAAAAFVCPVSGCPEGRGGNSSSRAAPACARLPPAFCAFSTIWCSSCKKDSWNWLEFAFWRFGSFSGITISR